MTAKRSLVQSNRRRDLIEVMQGSGRLRYSSVTIALVRMRKEKALRQILYVSRSTGVDGKADLAAIIDHSRHNNALDGITGLLWSDGTRFLQVLEGPEESVAATFDRISDDPRHAGLEILHDRIINTREFGSWRMACRDRWDAADAFDIKIRRDLSRAAPEIRDAFLDLVAVETPA